METFTYQPSIPAQIAFDPNVRTYELGDKYTESIPVGLQQNLKTYSLVWNNIDEELGTKIIDFFTRHKGYITFIWVDPLGDRLLWKCRTWNMRIRSGGFRSISANFNEVSF